MNDDLFMNDTLDNFVFTQTEDVITKSTTPKNVNAKEITPAGNRGLKVTDDISLDDSIFLSESLSFSADTEEKSKGEPENILQENKNILNVKNKNVVENRSSTNGHTKPPTFEGRGYSKNQDLQERKDNIINKNNKERLKVLHNSGDDSGISEGPKKIVNQYEKSTKEENETDINPELCKLSSWGLPEPVLEKYKSKKIVNMFPWQVQCLSNIEVLNNCKNLVYSAPTSAGKTLVAEILALKTIFERKKKVIFILPFVSIVREKMYYFQDVLASSGIRVEGFMGSYNPPGGFSAVEFAICTIEKANNLINRLMEEGKLCDIGAMLVDEIHLLGDPSRGYLLELLLTKLKYIAKKDENINIQIVGMSATLPNLNLLSKWLDAELYTTSFRPIPLHEQAHVCGEIYDNNLKLVRKLSPLPEVGMDTDNILQLCLETIKESCSVLIFCPTKNWCENLSQQIATAFLKIGNSGSEWGQLLRSQLKTELIMELLGQLKYCPVGLDAILCKTVSFGVAFHHAGLTMDERDIIEGAFRNGALRVLVATSTLSSGVNLPARRVIIRTPRFHGRPIDTLTYRQMIGRAGRMGKDALGESFLICQKNDYKIAKELMSAQLDPIESCLEGAGKLKRAILEVIASGVASSPDDVSLFTKCTLLAIEDECAEDLNNPIEEAVDFLKNNEFVRLQKQQDGSEKFVATSLGKACLSSSMAPDEGLALFTELEKARRCFVLETELHLVYLVTPYSACNSWENIDWMLYLDIWGKLPSTMKRVGELVGVQESYIINATRGKIQANTNKTYHKLMTHRRFFIALALQDLVNEKPLTDVCAKFNCNRGMLQSLQQSASSFAGMVTAFSRQLGWSSVEILLSQFQDRMQFGVSRDLLDLMRLSILNGPTARKLYNAGIETLTQLANNDVATIENILHKTIPFETKKEREGESEFDRQQRNKFKIIWVSGKEGLTEREAAEMLVENARVYLKLEMGLAEAKWENGDGDSDSSEAVKVDGGADSSGEMEVDDGCNRSEMECTSSSLSSMSVESKVVEDADKNDANLADDSIPKLTQDNYDQLISRNKSTITHTDNETKDEKCVIGTGDGNITPLEGKSTQIVTDFEKLKSVMEVEKESCVISNLPSFSGVDFTLIESDLEPRLLPKEEPKEKLNSFSSCSSFCDINFTQIEQNIPKNSNANSNAIHRTPFKDLHKTFTKNEVSQLLQPSEAELNISDSSVFSSSNGNMSANVNRSDQSLFDDSFNLHLSESDKESARNSSANIANELVAESEGQNERKNQSTELNISDDILSSSIEDLPNISRKRKKTSKENLSTPSKKKKSTKSQISDNTFRRNVPNLIDPTKYKIINVSENTAVWKSFERHLQAQKHFSLSLGCSRVKANKPLIGMNVLQPGCSNEEKKPLFAHKSKQVDGIAVTWNGSDVYYCPLEDNVDFSGNVSTLFQTVLGNKSVRVNIFHAKEAIKLLYFCCRIRCEARINDPTIADWLLEPEGKEKGLWTLATKYSPDIVKKGSINLVHKRTGSFAMNIDLSQASQLRASVEAVVAWHTMNFLKTKLSSTNNNYIDIYDKEMDTVMCLIKMEINGISVKSHLLRKLVDKLKNQMAIIERTAFTLAGRRFNFSSSTDVAKVLGIFKGKKVSTRKQILEQNSHPISVLVLQWRKMHSILIKTIYPLAKVVEDDRIRGNCIMHTATGRITMHEPNLQNIAKDFTITNASNREIIYISCRSVFQAPNNYILVSADYCQLELRILAHLSRDATLCSIMKQPGDVFKSIAAKWNKVEESEVTDMMRQNTKQICYGIIYGMKSRTLSKQLEVEEPEAARFMETFMNTYPGIKIFINKTIEKCKSKGYIETIFGRRRYLPHITDQNISKRGQAERQAVNTTVQGTAADIAKRAMIVIEKKFQNIFLEGVDKPKLVLHLHDELLYEVSEKYNKVIEIIKMNMENCVKLSVPLPVKVKTGRSWGEMTEYKM